MSDARIALSPVRAYPLRPDSPVSVLDDPAWRAERAAMGGVAKAERHHERQRDAAETLPPMDSTENALQRLEIIGRLSVAGVISGSQAHAAVQSVRAWLEVQRFSVTLERVRELERRIDDLTQELAIARAQRMG